MHQRRVKHHHGCLTALMILMRGTAPKVRQSPALLRKVASETDGQHGLRRAPRCEQPSAPANPQSQQVSRDWSAD